MDEFTPAPDAASALAADNYVMPFQLENSGVRGRLIRLGSVVNDILSKHDYPEPVSTLLGEAVTMTAMLGAALKIDGRFILQMQSDGPVSFLVVHYTSPGHVRGYASFKKDAVAKANGRATAKTMLGDGHLAMTIDPGSGMQRYQGIVTLAGDTLADAAHEYFDRSEQIPTFIRIAVARHYSAAASVMERGRWAWRGGGIIVQKLTQEGGRPVGDEVLPPTMDDDPDSNEGWHRAQALAATVEDHELLDPTLAAEHLLYRLFHEEKVRAFDVASIDARCSCTGGKVEQMLASFTPDDLTGMAENGAITVTCEFCNTNYTVDAKDYTSADRASGEEPH